MWAPTAHEHVTCLCKLLSICFQTLVTETASKEIYENSHSLLREILKEMSTKVDVGLSFKFSPSEKSMSNLTAGAEAGVEYEKKSMIKEVSEYTTTQVNTGQELHQSGGGVLQTVNASLPHV